MWYARVPVVVGGVLISLFSVMAPVQSVVAMNAGMTLPGDPRAANLIAAEQTLVDLTNADRQANGVDPLQFDPDSLPIARERAESQLGTQALSHYDEQGNLIFAELLSEANLSYGLAGENLARASSDDPDIIERIETALMQSPLHRRNILERTFKRVAIGAATDPSGQIAFAEVYRD